VFCRRSRGEERISFQKAEGRKKEGEYIVLINARLLLTFVAPFVNHHQLLPHALRPALAAIVAASGPSSRRCSVAVAVVVATR
jgi:hypothetical protein